MGNNPSARQTARRLINSHRPKGAGGESAARAAAAACDDLYRELSQWVGADGCRALFTRALTEARAELPVLAQIRLSAGHEAILDGVPETIMANGDAATAEALESMLVLLLELLGRLIGDDMAMKLIERCSSASERGDTNSDSRREEA